MYPILISLVSDQNLSLNQKEYIYKEFRTYETKYFVEIHMTIKLMMMTTFRGWP